MPLSLKVKAHRRALAKTRGVMQDARPRDGHSGPTAGRHGRLRLNCGLLIWSLDKVGQIR